jgi:predicted RNase H-like HicB family nuclease
MAYIVCAEEIDGHWVAHVPDLPGCFTTHDEREKAIQAVPAAVEEFVTWCGGHDLRITGLSAPMIVSEVIRAWEFEDGHKVHAFFASDRPPLTEEELPEYEVLLRATMFDLLSVVNDLNPEAEHREFPGEARTIAGILGHVARGDLFYLDRLGLAFSQHELPEDARASLKKVGDHMLSTLPAMMKRSGAMTLAGETWSARKVLRRSLWHRRDHTFHIGKLCTKIGARQK